MGFSLGSVGTVYSGSGLSAIARRSKVKQDDVAKVLAVGLPTLVGGMNRNAAEAGGAEALARALTQHQAADISDPGAFLASSDLQDGKKIVNHVLGADQDEAMEEISRATGVSKSKVGTILALAAPLLLSLLGQQNSSASQAGSGGGLLSLLGGLLGMGSAQQNQQTVFQMAPQQNAYQMAPQQNVFQQFAPQMTQQQATPSGMNLISTLLGGGGASSSIDLFSSLLGGGQQTQTQSQGLGSLFGGGQQVQQQNFTLAGQQPQQVQQQQQDDNSGFLSMLMNLLH